MNIDPWNYVTEFEKALGEYTGAPYVITTDCATHAMELCLRHLNPIHPVQVPKHTYLSVPMMVEKIGAKLAFVNNPWEKYYYLEPYPVIDGSVHFEKDCYVPGTFYCLSFQHKKRLNLGRGGAILTDNKEAYDMLMMMRYDGRTMPKDWTKDVVSMLGYHYYMTPEQAQKGLLDLKENNLKPYETKCYTDYPNLVKFSYFSKHDDEAVFHDGYHDYMYVWKPKEGELLEIFVGDDGVCNIENTYHILENTFNGRKIPYICALLFLIYRHQPKIIEEFQDDMYMLSINHNHYYRYANIKTLFPSLKSIKIFEIEVLWSKDYLADSEGNTTSSVNDWFTENKLGNFVYQNFENIKQFAINNDLDVTYHVCETGYEHLDPEYLQSLKFKIKHFNLFLISQAIEFRDLAKTRDRQMSTLKNKLITDVLTNSLSNDKKKILNLNRRPDWHRHLLAQTLLGQFEKTKDRVKVTWLNQDIKAYNQHMLVNGKSDYVNFEQHLLPALTAKEREYFDRGELILKNSDLRLDKDFRNNEFFLRYLDAIDLYEDVVFEIVSESIYFGPAGDVSEKSLRPLLMGVPFVIMGGPGSFKNLEKLGFISYNNIINHNDEERNHLTRFRSIANFTEQLASLSDEEYSTTLRQIYTKFAPIIVHNRQNFVSDNIINNIKKWIQEIHQ